MSIKKYSSGLWVTVPYRKYETATDTITSLPKTIIGDGQNISAYTIKGNMTQASQPTPQNPVYPQETGDKTANLLNPNTMTAGYAVSDSSGNLSPSANDSASDYINVSGFTNVYIRSYQTARKWGAFYDANKDFVSGFSFYTATQSVPQNAVYMRVTITTANLDTAMVLEGSTPPTSYIPYGYKIPISFGQNTYNIYITEPLRKSLDGSNVYDELSSNGTLTRRVDENGDALATPTTEQVTVPTLTTTGTAEQFNVLTTLAPSEVSLTYHGWHEHSDTKYTSG